MSFRTSILLLLTLFSTFVRVACSSVTPYNCTNAACDYCVNLAATCQDMPTEQTSNQPNTCLCTQRFEINLSRCLSGYVCAWDGTSDPGTGVCSDIYCPGTFDEDFINQCPNISPATGTPGPRPITVTTPSASAISGSATETHTTTITGGNTTGTPTPTTTITTATGSPTSSTPSFGTKLGVDKLSALLVAMIMVALGMVIIH